MYVENNDTSGAALDKASLNTHIFRVLYNKQQKCDSDG